MTPTGKRIPVNGRPPVDGRPPVNGQPAAADDTSAAAPDQALAAELEQLKAELEAARQECAAAQDSELRLRAEWENFRKRAHRDAAEARERAQGHLLTEMLPVLDNLERALDAAEHHDEGKVLGGVRMVRDMFVDLLRRSGVEEIPTVGTAFDPHVHDAVVMRPSPQDEGTITAVLERGYTQGDRVLRPARVAVSSGPAESGA